MNQDELDRTHVGCIAIMAAKHGLWSAVGHDAAHGMVVCARALLSDPEASIPATLFDGDTEAQERFRVSTVGMGTVLLKRNIDARRITTTRSLNEPTRTLDHTSVPS